MGRMATDDDEAIAAWITRIDPISLRRTDGDVTLSMDFSGVHLLLEGRSMLRPYEILWSFEPLQVSERVLLGCGIGLHS